MQKIGILGGTFDPPHNAHVAMAQAAVERVPLDRVLFMPSPKPPHKESAGMTPYELRAQMVSLAINGHAGLELSRLEEENTGVSYTVDLLEAFRKRSQDEIFLILGADSVSDLPTWKDPTSILSLVTLVIFPRTGFSSVVPVEGDASVILFEDPVIDIASKDIRSKRRSGQSIEADVPKSVHKFILDNSLYS